MGKSKIEWTDRVLNVTTGCTPESEGCENCYARAYSKRFWKGRDFSEVMIHPDRLIEQTKISKPSDIFLSSLGDLFHPEVPYEFIRLVLFMVFENYEHRFFILTKRPERMCDAIKHFILNEYVKWPPQNLCIGVTAENQARADERIPVLLSIPAAVRFVSLEPLLGSVELWRIDEDSITLRGVGIIRSGGMTIDTADYPAEGYDNSYPGLDWVICGGETGPNARPMHPDWVRSVRDQCIKSETPFFFKQWGEWEIASDENGHVGSVMPEGGRKYVWIGKNGKTSCPSALQNQDCWAMARVGKKKAGRLLDGKEWLQKPRRYLQDEEGYT